MSGADTAGNQRTRGTVREDRRRLGIALVANLAMAAIGLFGAWLAQSTGLLADAFDMLADASGYVFAWVVVGRALRHQVRAARWNGAMLIVLGAGVLGEVAHRWVA